MFLLSAKCSLYCDEAGEELIQSVQQLCGHPGVAKINTRLDSLHHGKEQFIYSDNDIMFIYRNEFHLKCIIIFFHTCIFIQKHA